MAWHDPSPLQGPFPSLEVGPFYCSYEDDRWDEPEFIVDPLSGFVVAIVPPRHRSASPERRTHSNRSFWRTKLQQWPRFAGAALMVVGLVPARVIALLAPSCCGGRLRRRRGRSRRRPVSHRH